MNDYVLTGDKEFKNQESRIKKKMTADRRPRHEKIKQQIPSTKFQNLSVFLLWATIHITFFVILVTGFWDLPVKKRQTSFAI
jgi:hypothetical protein